LSRSRLGRPPLVDRVDEVVNNVVMQAAIAEVKKRLCALVDQVEAGATIVILRHGRPVARLMPMPGSAQPWRVDTPDDPRAYRKIDLDAPILEEI
jgi:prevent-host-death family protein